MEEDRECLLRIVPRQAEDRGLGRDPGEHQLWMIMDAPLWIAKEAEEVPRHRDIPILDEVRLLIKAMVTTTMGMALQCRRQGTDLVHRVGA